MKNFAMIIIGSMILAIMMVCPLPPFFGISGNTWRAVIALLSCVLIGRGIYQIKKRMKDFAMIIIGSMILAIMMVCPLPPFFGISGITWRAVIALLSCVLIGRGIYQIKKKK